MHRGRGRNRGRGRGRSRGRGRGRGRESDIRAALTAFAQRLPPPPGPSLLERVDDDTARFPTSLSARDRSAAHGVCGDLGLHHWSEDVRDGGRRCVASRRRRPDPHGARAASEVAALASSRLTRPQAAWPAPRNDLRRVADDAWERFDGSTWAPCDRTGAFEHAAATAALVAAGPPRPAPVAARPPQVPVEVVDSTDALQAMAAELARSKTPIAIDVEAHAEFSFEGFACLLQVSTHSKDYVVDCLALRAEVGPALRAVFADPAIRKIFHSCEGVDIPRLDRDFGIRVVNCWDTQIAAAALELPLGLVDLLGACGVVDGAWAARAAILKKRFQNCDWRRRPLSSDQVDYARGDATHLLALDAALWTRLAASPELERAAFADSQAAPARALWRPPRASWLAAERDKRLPRDDTQARRFVDLYAWRDAAARRVDESPHAVCPAAALVEFSKRAPADADALGIAFEPLPPYVACDAFGLRGELLARIRMWS